MLKASENPDFKNGSCTKPMARAALLAAPQSSRFCLRVWGGTFILSGKKNQTKASLIPKNKLV